MSFNYGTTGKAFEPGYFLAHDEAAVRETRTIPAADGETNVYGGKVVKAGTVFPKNDATAIGIVYEDVDVTSGDMPGSVVTSGTVYTDKLPVTLADDAKTALAALGFKFTTTPAVTRV